jgi:hypothetical protein
MPRPAKLSLLIVLVVLVMVRSGQSLALTAKEMQVNCLELTAKARPAGGDQLDIPNSPGALVCFGFFSAVQRFTVFQREGERRRIFGICAPPQTTLLQLIELFQKYVKANPREADQDAADVALTAYAKKFPCPQAASSGLWQRKLPSAEALAQALISVERVKGSHLPRSRSWA